MFETSPPTRDGEERRDTHGEEIVTETRKLKFRRTRTPQVNEIQSSVVKFPFQESLQMVRTMISSSSAFGSAGRRARRFLARVHKTNTGTFGLVFDLSSGDSGLARARCGPFTGSCGRTRALRATLRESVARVTLRWSAEPSFPKNSLGRGRRARSRARQETIASAGSNDKQIRTRTHEEV